MPTDLLSAALRYAERGWPTFPVGPDKKPLSGSHGFHDASVDPEILKRMPWDRAMGIAISTGPAHLLVLDVDPPEGEKSLATLILDIGRPLPPTYTVQTPRGGFHHYYRVLSQVPSSAGRLAPNLDVRAEGGYVVAPPTPGYTVILDEDIRDLLGEIVSRALDPKAAPKPNGHDEKIREGERHARLLSLAGALRRKGADAVEIEESLRAVNRRRCLPPLSEKELLELAEDVAKRYRPEDEPEISNQEIRIYTHGELEAAAKALDLEPRYPCEIPDLDAKMNGGYCRRWTVVFGAFTQNGKTRLVGHQARSFARRGHRVLVVSLELAIVEFCRLMATVESNSEVLNRIFYFDASDELTTLLRIVESWHDANAEKPDILILDYVQRVSAAVRKSDSREQEISLSVKRLGRLVRKLGMIGILAAQLNRHSQEDTPKLHHLRESGSIEQIADVALLLQKIDPTRLRIELAKFRWGTAPAEILIQTDWSQLTLLGLDPVQAALDMPKKNQRKVTTRKRLLDAIVLLQSSCPEGVSLGALVDKLEIGRTTAQRYLEEMVAEKLVTEVRIAREIGGKPICLYTIGSMPT